MKNFGAGGLLIKIKMKRIKGLNKYLGLMFKIHPEVLVFEFDKPIITPIHSLFCRSFYAEWYDEKDNLIERRLVKPFRINIKPKNKYKKLIEIPCYKGSTSGISEMRLSED